MTENQDGTALAELERMLISSEARLAIKAAGGSEKLLLPVVLPQLAVRRDGGVVRIAVAGEDGRDRVANTGSPLTVKELVLELKQDPELAPAFVTERPAARRARDDDTWSPGRPITISREDAKDTRKYEQAKSEAARLGVALLISQERVPIAVPPGALVLDRVSAKDHTAYAAAKAQASKEGRPFQIAQESPARQPNAFWISREDARDTKKYAEAKARAAAAGGVLVIEQP